MGAARDTGDTRLRVLLISRQKDTLDALAGALRSEPGIKTERRLLVNGHLDPLEGLESLPDAVVLHLGEAWQTELEALAARPPDRRPLLIVVGPANDTNIMRLAMRAGARDLLPLPLDDTDLIAALARIQRDHQAAKARDEARVVAFMNAKGGCGATILACNVAHMLSAVSRQRVMLIDLDLQFGAVPLYFDQFPKRGLLQALENLENLDATALEGYTVKHASGLKILGQAADDPLPLSSPGSQQLEQLLNIALRDHDYVVVDLPRRIDAAAGVVIEHAERIVLVVQQSVAVLRDATRLIGCLERNLAVSRERIVTVINRYAKDAAISVDDVRNMLGCGDITLVPNDYRTVSECVETGVPLLLHARSAPITKAVAGLETRLGGNHSSEEPGLLARTLSAFIKARSA
jgi:pilus assembly protein CpaE